MTNPWAPVNETHSQIWLEQVLIDGGDVAFVAYGVHATLFFLTATLLWEKRHIRPKYTYGMLGYITLVFILGSIGAGCALRLNEVAFVDDRNYPGGPGAFDVEQNSITFNIVGTGAYTVNTWLADGLLLYRFFMFTGSRWWISVVPAGVLTVSIVCGSILLAQLAQPGAQLFSGSTVNFALIFWWTDIATTILLTVVIVGRLIHMRWKLRRVMGTDDIAPYLSLSAMLLESAFLYTAWAVAFIITYAQNLSINLFFFQPLGQIQSIAPLLIILRVAQGRAMTSQRLSESSTMTNGPSSMVFAPRSQTSLPTTTFSTSTAAYTNQTLDKSKSINSLNGHMHKNSSEVSVY